MKTTNHQTVFAEIIAYCNEHKDIKAVDVYQHLAANCKKAPTFGSINTYLNLLTQKSYIRNVKSDVYERLSVIPTDKPASFFSRWQRRRTSCRS